MSMRRGIGALSAVVLTLALAVPAAAQDRMAAGTWTGTVITPEGEVFDMMYDVSYADDVLAIDLIPPAEVGMGSVTTNEPVEEAGMLVFSFDIGQSINCSLQRQDDGSYEGECVDSTGGAAVMTMMPPADGRG